MQQAIQSISLFLGAVEKNKRFDIIICGGGAAGLLLANALSNETAFKHLHIAIIEKEEKNTNDRTWCFWEEGEGKWDEIYLTPGEKHSLKQKDIAPNLT